MTEPIKEGLKQLLSEAQELAGRGGPEGTAPRCYPGLPLRFLTGCSRERAASRAARASARRRRLA
jgi:hypothetical protein